MTSPHHPLVIIGGGIGGLTLALCLDQAYNHRHDANDNKLEIHVYESTAAYTQEAGGAIGLYPNGLRVLKNLSTGFDFKSRNDDDTANTTAAATTKIHPSVPSLLNEVRSAGCPYIYRRWMRHDGTEVAVAREDELLPELDVDDDDDGVVLDGGSAAEEEEGRKEEKAAINGGIKKSGNNTLAAQKADLRPRGGSFRLVKDTVDTSLKRLSRISLASNDTSTTTTTSSTGGRSSEISIETELLSLGIRRWRYQQVLYEACQSVGIVIHFGKRLVSITSTTSQQDEQDDAISLLSFKDGTTATATLVIGADGINSKVRNYIANPTNDTDAAQRISEYNPEYTGTTCLMGCANVERIRGISFPSSVTTRCHACYYPTRVPTTYCEGDELDEPMHGATSSKNKEVQHEQVFQIYFPSPIERPDTWRTLTPEEAKVECRELASQMRKDGWDEQFLEPLESETLSGVLRVGLRSRQALDVWHIGGSSGSNKDCARAVLLGDAAHPPVPYIGQGAMMAMEDAGTLSLVLAHFCPLKKLDGTASGSGGSLDYTKFDEAMETYEKLRVQRTKNILGSSVELGKTQQKRAESKLYNVYREWSIKTQVWLFGTLPVMRPGAAFDYVGGLEEALCGGVE